MSRLLPSAPTATVAKDESGALFSAPGDSILPKSCRLVLPPVIHAVLGEEVNIYFKNITLAPEGKTYLFDVECAQGRQYRERWAFTPETTESVPWKVEVRDLEDSVLASGSTVIKVARADAGADCSIRFLGLGDSLTAAGVYTEELRTLFARPGNPTLILTGSHHSEGTREGNLHEGYGGWKFIDFLEKFEPLPKPGSTVRQSSPFVFNENGQPVLDVARYVRESLKGEQPDFVFVFLGTNDLFTFAEAHRETAVKKIADHAGRLLKEIRTAMPAAKIGLSGPVPPSDQDAFAENYGSQYTAWGCRKSQHRLAEELQQRFSGLEREGIYYVPLLTNFDADSDYIIRCDLPANARARRTVSRAMNAVHPDQPGYQHWADTIYAWMKNLLDAS